MGPTPRRPSVSCPRLGNSWREPRRRDGDGGVVRGCPFTSSEVLVVLPTERFPWAVWSTDQWALYAEVEEFASGFNWHWARSAPYRGLPEVKPSLDLRSNGGADDPAVAGALSAVY